MGWPKCSWVRSEVESLLQSLPAEDAMLVQTVHASLARIMSQSDIPGLGLPAKPPRYYCAEQEALLQTGPFAPWRPASTRFGTVSQRVLVSNARTAELHYFYRSTNGKPSSEASGAPA